MTMKDYGYVGSVNLAMYTYSNWANCSEKNTLHNVILHGCVSFMDCPKHLLFWGTVKSTGSHLEKGRTLSFLVCALKVERENDRSSRHKGLSRWSQLTAWHKFLNEVISQSLTQCLIRSSEKQLHKSYILNYKVRTNTLPITNEIDIFWLIIQI